MTYKKIIYKSYLERESSFIRETIVNISQSSTKIGFRIQQILKPRALLDYVFLIEK